MTHDEAPSFRRHNDFAPPVQRATPTSGAGPGAGRAQRDDQPGDGEQAAGDRQRRPAIVFEDGRDRHGDDRDQHARIGRLGRADRADDPVIEPEGERRGDQAEIEQAEPVGRARVEHRRADERQANSGVDQRRHRASPSRAWRDRPRLDRRHELHDVGDRGGEHGARGRRPSPVEHVAGRASRLSRISWTNSRPTPAIATAEPSTKRPLTRSPKNSQASAALGTTSKAKTTAARPEVM